MSELLPTKERAAHIRKELKAMFPNTKFKVRSSSFNIGSDVSVSWVDGPTEEAVNNVLVCLAVDLEHLYDVKLETSYNWISINRTISDEAWKSVENEVKEWLIKTDDCRINEYGWIQRKVSSEIEERNF